MSSIEEVKSRLDIVEIIGEQVPLKKAGRNYKGLCPFHQEKTPSFIVFPESQHYHCFGCGAKGDAFTFVMQTENVDFPEALRLLARRAGVVLRPPTPQEQESDRQRHRLQELNLAAAQFFQHQLRYGDAGAMARGYLEQRGMTAETIETYLLGYAPDRWDALSAYLRERGYHDDELNTAGLVVERESARRPGEHPYYDRFRNRLIFPIRDLQGHVVGFGGRALAEDQQPKYLNSPQTPLFDKGAVLYGLDQAGAAIRRQGQAVLVEGYFDVLMAHQQGYKNVVAPMGTALTTTQVSLLKRLTHRLFLALDADAAGALAMLRGLEVIREAMDERTVLVPTAQGLLRSERELDGEVRIVVLPAGEDPDEVIRASPAQWEERIAKALPVLEFALQQIAQQADLSTAKGKAEAVRQALPLLAEVHDPVEQAHYIQRLAHIVQVEERAIAVQLRRPGPARVGRAGPGRVREATPIAPEIPLLTRKEDVVEGYFLALLYRFPQLPGRLPAGIAALLSQEEHRVLLEMLMQGTARAAEDLPSELRSHLEDLSSHFQADLSLDEQTARRALEATVDRLEVLANERQRREYSDVLAQAEEEGNRDMIQEVRGRLSRLSQRRWDIAMPPPRRLFPDLRRYLDEEGEEPAPEAG
jgi:DNA primase